MRRLIAAGLATAAIVLSASEGYSQTPAPGGSRQVPDFTVQVWGSVAADFTARIADYYELRQALQIGSPVLTVTDNAADISMAQRALARRIRAARKGSRQGEMFTPAISAEFKRVLTLQMDANTLATIMDDNPLEFRQKINGDYPEGKPRSTMPANILAVLPELPDELQYQFVGRDLILLDTRSAVIIDRIPYAIAMPKAIN